MADITIGPGALVIGGGMFFVVVSIAFFTGTEVGLEGFTGSPDRRPGVHRRHLLARQHPRDHPAGGRHRPRGPGRRRASPRSSGAMRISEEIDALEVMGVNSVVYLVATRVWAALITMIPLYLAALFSSYLATELIVTKFFGLSTGTYQHYFQLFLPPIDIFYSFLKAMVFAVAGHASSTATTATTRRGGPAGVGVAAGRAIRLSIIMVVARQPAVVPGPVRWRSTSRRSWSDEPACPAPRRCWSSRWSPWPLAQSPRPQRPTATSRATTALTGFFPRAGEGLHRAPRSSSAASRSAGSRRSRCRGPGRGHAADRPELPGARRRHRHHRAGQPVRRRAGVAHHAEPERRRPAVPAARRDPRPDGRLRRAGRPLRRRRPAAQAHQHHRPRHRRLRARRGQQRARARGSRPPSTRAASWPTSSTPTLRRPTGGARLVRQLHRGHRAATATRSTVSPRRRTSRCRRSMRRRPPTSQAPRQPHAVLQQLAAILLTDYHPTSSTLLADGDNIVAGLDRPAGRHRPGHPGRARVLLEAGRRRRARASCPTGPQFAYFNTFILFSDVNSLVCDLIAPPSAGLSFLEPLQQALAGAGHRLQLHDAAGGVRDAQNSATDRTISPGPPPAARPNAAAQSTGQPGLRHRSANRPSRCPLARRLHPALCSGGGL